MQAVVLFEDARWTNFKPLTWMRPVCLLRTGIFPLWEKVARACQAAGWQDFEVTSTPVATLRRLCAIA